MSQGFTVGQQTDNTKIPLAEKGVADGVGTLDSSGLQPIAEVNVAAVKTGLALTKSDVGLSNVPNLDTSNPANITQSAFYRFVTDTEKSTWDAKQAALGFTPVPNTRTVNGHALSADVTVTKADLSLGNVDNTSDANKPISTATQIALNGKQASLGFTPENAANKGAVSGYASLTAAQKHLASEIPFGSAANTVCQGNDSRLSDSRTPTSHASSHITGGSDVIANAVADGDSGLMSGADKAKLDGKSHYLMTAIQAFSSNTYAGVTELTTPILQPGTYRFDFTGLVQSASTNTGVGVRIGAGTATLSTCFGEWRIGQTANGTTSTFQYTQTSTATNVTSTSSLAANSNDGINGKGLFIVTVAGTVQLQARSESNGTAITLQPGCCLSVEKVG